MPRTENPVQPSGVPSTRREGDAMRPVRWRDDEAGMAYLAVLLVVLVLTTLAVALTFISTTEMRIGANERTVQRTLGAAEAGVGISLARMLVVADYSESEYTLRATADEDPATPPRVGTRVEQAPLLPLLEAPCNLCQINDAGNYGAQGYARINAAATAVGVRRAGAVRSGERTVSAILDVQPVVVPTSAYFPLAEEDPAVLAEKVRF